MEYKLTTNTKKIYNTIVFQIQQTDNKKLGGYIDEESFISSKGRAWVHKDGILIRSSIAGDCSIHGLVIDSEIKGKIIVDKNTTIENCVIDNPTQILGLINGAKLENQQFSFYSKLIPEIAESETIKSVWCDGVLVLLGKTHYQVGCFGGLYSDAIVLLQNSKLMQEQIDKALQQSSNFEEYTKLSLLSSPRVQNSLLQLAKTQLKKEGN